MSSSRPGHPFKRRRITLRLFVSCLSLLLIFAALPLASTSHAQDESVLPSGRRSETAKNNLIEFVPGEILVRFRTDAIADTKEQVMAPLRALGQEISVDVQPFGENGENLETIEGLRFARVAPDETLEAIAALNARPDVLYAEPNYIRRRDVTVPNDPQFGSLWGLRNTGQTGFNDATQQSEPGRVDADIDADEAWDITTGSRTVVVGVVDEGIDINHQDLQANIWTNPGDSTVDGVDNDGNGKIDDTNGWDFFSNDRTVYDGSATNDPATSYNEMEFDSHGTHVAGTIGAVGNNGVGVAGVNWQVSIMSLKILGSDGQTAAPATVRRTVQAYDYAVAMRNRGVNLRVLNNSYGGGGKSQTEIDAILRLNQAGILFVASAGNDANDSDSFPHYPSNYDVPNIIGVAATNRFDDLAVFSTFGARTVSIGAPGRSILSTTPNNTYRLFSGTSMAAPHVSGAAALVVAANPNLTVSQLRGVIAYSGDVIPSLLGKTTTGRRLNVYNSILSARENNGGVDTTSPGIPGNFNVSSQDGRSITLSFTAPGDDGNSGRAADYDLVFTDPSTSSRYVLPTSTIPAAPGTPQSITVNLPYRRFSGSVTLRTIDNAGNASEVSVNVTVTQNAGSDPYVLNATAASGLVGGGTGLSLIGDDKFKENHPLPFAFPFFGKTYNSITVSTNGALYFSRIPRDEDDATIGLDAGSSVEALTGQTMIAGMWDDLRTDRNGGDVFVTSDSNRIIFRWLGTTYNTPLSGGTTRGENPIEFEIELRPDGTIQFRYGGGNTKLFPVVGISAGEPDAYVVTTHTSEQFTKNLTNAQTITFSPRAGTPPPPANQIDDISFFVRQHYLDFLNREPEQGGFDYWTGLLRGCNGDSNCLNGVRVEISSRFFAELEFQRTGYYVMRLYRASFGRFPNYQEFTADRQLVQNNEASQRAFAAQFIQRNEFQAKYGALNNQNFVNLLYDTTAGAGSFAAERQAHITALTSGQKTRADVLHEVANLPIFAERTPIYNQAWVRMQYFGYLRRDAEAQGEAYWINVINNQLPNNYQAMICAFLNSAEYHGRFGTQRGQFTETSCSRFY
jgi:subtilisin family serine protease